MHTLHVLLFLLLVILNMSIARTNIERESNTFKSRQKLENLQTKNQTEIAFV